MMALVDRFSRPLRSTKAPKTIIDGFGFQLPEGHGFLHIDPTKLEDPTETPSYHAKAAVELANKLSHLLHACAHEIVSLRGRIEELEARTKEGAAESTATPSATGDD